MKPQNNDQDNSRVIEIKRVSKKTKGGNRISFTALVVAGDKTSSAGIGLGKAPIVVSAIKKAIRLAQKHFIKVPIVSGTIPYETTYKFKAAKVFLKPAPKGTGIIAGGMAGGCGVATGLWRSPSINQTGKTTMKSYKYKLRLMIIGFEFFASLVCRSFRHWAMRTGQDVCARVGSSPH